MTNPDLIAKAVAEEARALGGKAKTPEGPAAREVMRWLQIKDPLEETGATRDELVAFGRGKLNPDLMWRLRAIQRDLPRHIQLPSLALILAAVADRREG